MPCGNCGREDCPTKDPREFVATGYPALLSCERAKSARLAGELAQALAKLAAGPWQPAHPETEREQALLARAEKAERELAAALAPAETKKEPTP
jgi:hypothetical protein